MRGTKSLSRAISPTSGADSTQLLPLIDQIRANTEALPKQVSADAGYAWDEI